MDGEGSSTDQYIDLETAMKMMDAQLQQTRKAAAVTSDSDHVTTGNDGDHRGPPVDKQYFDVSEVKNMLENFKSLNRPKSTPKSPDVKRSSVDDNDKDDSTLQLYAVVKPRQKPVGKPQRPPSKLGSKGAAADDEDAAVYTAVNKQNKSSCPTAGVNVIDKPPPPSSPPSDPLYDSIRRDSVPEVEEPYAVVRVVPTDVTQDPASQNPPADCTPSVDPPSATVKQQSPTSSPTSIEENGVFRFTVRSLGSMTISGDDLAGNRGPSAIFDCVRAVTGGTSNKLQASTPAVTHRWPTNTDIELRLNEKRLVLVDLSTTKVLNEQSLKSIRLWGTGPEADSVYFAYVSRNIPNLPEPVGATSGTATSKSSSTNNKPTFVCHVFQCCHPGDRASHIIIALRDICRSIAAAASSKKTTTTAVPTANNRPSAAASVASVNTTVSDTNTTL